MAKVSVRNRNKDQVYKNGKKKPANWEYRFEKAPINGKRQHESKSGFRTQKEALEAGNKALTEYLNGGFTAAPSDISVSDYLDLWMNKYVKVNLKPKTEITYKSRIDTKLKPAIGHYKLSALNPTILQDFANDLKKEGHSQNHVSNLIRTLKGALKYAVQPLQYLKFNPCEYVVIPKIEKEGRKRIILSPENWNKIISRFPFGDKYHMPLMIGYHTGMRISEVLALTWNDIDFENSTIEVNKQFIKYQTEGKKGVWAIAPPKSKAGYRTIKIDSTLLETLKRENIRQKQARLMYGEYYAKYTSKHIKDKIFEVIPAAEHDLQFICSRDNGTFVTTNAFKYCSRIIHNELKLDFDFHSLRHTHATILAENGVNPKNLQARLGHENIETTLQIYVHDTFKMCDETIDIFERALRGQN